MELLRCSSYGFGSSTSSPAYLFHSMSSLVLILLFMACAGPADSSEGGSTAMSDAWASACREIALEFGRAAATVALRSNDSELRLATMHMLCAKGEERDLLQVDPRTLRGELSGDVVALADAFISGITHESAPQRISTLAQARVWQRAGGVIVVSPRTGHVSDARWAARCVTLKLLYSGWLIEACTLACYVQGVSLTLASAEAGSAIISRWLAEQRRIETQDDDNTSWESIWYRWIAVTRKEVWSMLV